MTRFYSNVSRFDINTSIKYSRSVPHKLNEAKNPLEKFFISPRGASNICQFLRPPLFPTVHLLVRMTFGDSLESTGTGKRDIPIDMPSAPADTSWTSTIEVTSIMKRHFRHLLLLTVISQMSLV